MKKLMLALATVAFIGIGGSAVSGAAPSVLPPGCTEPSNVPGTECYDAELYPIRVQPPAAPVPPTVPVTVPVGELPRTGSGVSPILGIGALLLVGGGIVVVATRRRSTSTSST
jgi:LPXTG-motif cell wall-anchored protein